MVMKPGWVATMNVSILSKTPLLGSTVHWTLALLTQKLWVFINLHINVVLCTNPLIINYEMSVYILYRLLRQFLSPGLWDLHFCDSFFLLFQQQVMTQFTLSSCFPDTCSSEGITSFLVPLLHSIIPTLHYSNVTCEEKTSTVADGDKKLIAL